MTQTRHRGAALTLRALAAIFRLQALSAIVAQGGSHEAGDGCSEEGHVLSSHFW
jgi:hypothetical protein